MNEQNKSLTRGCESLDQVKGARDYVRCNDPGVRRYDNDLDSGIHCDRHWKKLVLDGRKRSW